MHVHVIMEKKTVYHKSSPAAAALHSPSFSSSLLDSIYRSIDEEGGVKVPEEGAFYKGLTITTGKNWPGPSALRERDYGEEETVEKWTMDKRRSSVKAAADGRKSLSAVLSSSNSNSSSSSSDSSFWSGGLSSSESDSSYCPKSTSSSCRSVQRPKPVRAERNSDASPSHKSRKPHDHAEVPAKTRSRALKIYAELKKAKSKQPISPGSRLASFLNSLFANSKKKPRTVLEPFRETCDEKGGKFKHTKSKLTPASCPSSASSRTRSCLSKTLSSSSGEKPGNNVVVGKRSVRFDPVSVIVDEDSQPCGSKNLQGEDELKIHVMAENRRVAEAARKLLESYRTKKASSGGDPKDCDDDLAEEEEYVDDAESCSSSDLFELHNLSEIGIDRYRDELPVYETTHIYTNRAIASGLVL